ncbi:MAG TPA: SDR family NAD(P)-dependent oxidoreductase [Steroidobacteraceae bacterium]|nr:SDR family NAD(P)-dependent oxidoreductase [Steroidobacteraceae bacterium]
MDIRESLAVVTGGASGLGRAVVARVVAEGGKAVILDMQEEAGRAAAQELGASFLRCDVSDESQVIDAMSHAQRTLGGMNVLVNCAGVVGAGKLLGKQGPMAGAFFEQVVRVNLVGTLLCDKTAAALMRDNAPNAEGERGVLIHTASVAAFEGQIGQVAYAATKAGIIGMTLPIARELAAFGIRCVSIAPGIFMTPMLAGLPQDVQASLGTQVPFPPRLGKPEEFARLVQSILEIPTLNGEVIRLDGAIRMQPR